MRRRPGALAGLFVASGLVLLGLWALVEIVAIRLALDDARSACSTSTWSSWQASPAGSTGSSTPPSTASTPPTGAPRAARC
jgi:hypothetical protein